MARDPFKAAPKHCEVEFENDRVGVLRIRYGPHEKSVMHGHPACIVVILGDCDFRFNLPHGKRQDILGKAGEIIRSRRYWSSRKRRRTIPERDKSFPRVRENFERSHDSSDKKKARPSGDGFGNEKARSRRWSSYSK